MDDDPLNQPDLETVTECKCRCGFVSNPPAVFQGRYVCARCSTFLLTYRRPVGPESPIPTERLSD